MREMASPLPSRQREGGGRGDEEEKSEERGGQRGEDRRIEELEAEESEQREDLEGRSRMATS